VQNVPLTLTQIQLSSVKNVWTALPLMMISNVLIHLKVHYFLQQ